MHFFWQAVLKDLRRHREDPWKPATWVGIPLVIATLITLATGGSAGPRVTVDLLIADQDDSLISGLLVGALSQDVADGLFRTEKVQQEAGRIRIEQDKATAMLVIPAGFGEALLRERPMELLLVTNPSQQILPRIAEETVRILVDGSFYAHRILGEELQQIADWVDDADTEVTEKRISETSVRISQIAKRVSSHLDPLAIELEMAVDEVEQPAADQPSSAEFSVAYYFFPGMLIVALFLTSDGLGGDIWTERENGTLLRLVTTPRSLRVFLAGKCVAGCIFIAVVSIVLLVIGLYYHGRPWGPLPLATAWMVLSGSVLWSILVSVQLFASSQRAGTVLTSAATFPLLMLGGSFFPFEAMPEWMAAIGRWTPNGWMLEHLKAILLGNAKFSSLAPAVLALLVVFVVFFLIASRRLYAIRSRAA
jgi:ABC-type multidrug transport system permease subunit